MRLGRTASQEASKQVNLEPKGGISRTNKKQIHVIFSGRAHRGRPLFSPHKCSWRSRSIFCRPGEAVRVFSHMSEGSYRQSTNGRTKRKITFKTHQRPPIQVPLSKSFTTVNIEATAPLAFAFEIVYLTEVSFSKCTIFRKWRTESVSRWIADFL